MPAMEMRAPNAQSLVEAPRAHPRVITDGAECVPASEWTASGREPQVFLDERGRRRRWVLAGGAIAGLLASVWLAALISGGVGFATLPSLRLAASPTGAVRSGSAELSKRRGSAQRLEVALRAPSGPVQPDRSPARRVAAVSHSAFERRASRRRAGRVVLAAVLAR